MIFVDDKKVLRIGFADEEDNYISNICTGITSTSASLFVHGFLPVRDNFTFKVRITEGTGKLIAKDTRISIVKLC